MMYVRFIGPNKACWTLSNGQFYIGDREELTLQELIICEAGGGYLPQSVSVILVAH